MVSTDNDGFLMFNNGFFSALGKDSASVWNETHAGTYKIDNPNTVSLKALYSSYSDHINSIQTMGFDVSSETLTLKWFKKLVDPNGVDITAQAPKGLETKYVRAKR